MAKANINKADLPFEVFFNDYFKPVVTNHDRTIDELKLLQDLLETRIKVFKAIQIKFGDKVYVPFGKSKELLPGEVYGVSKDGVTVEGEFGKRSKLTFDFDKVITEEEYETIKGSK